MVLPEVSAQSEIDGGYGDSLPDPASGTVEPGQINERVGGSGKLSPERIGNIVKIAVPNCQIVIDVLGI